MDDLIKSAQGLLISTIVMAPISVFIIWLASFAHLFVVLAVVVALMVGYFMLIVWSGT